MRHPRQVLTRASIFDRVWGYDFGPASNSLEVYVGYLRRKTEAAGRAAPGAHRARRRLRAEVIAAMSFRRRMVLLAAGAVAAAIVIASVVVYVVTRNELHDQIDTSLRATITPGLPQAVRLRPLPTASQLAKLNKSGKQPNVRASAHSRSRRAAVRRGGDRLIRRSRKPVDRIHARLRRRGPCAHEPRRSRGSAHDRTQDRDRAGSARASSARRRPPALPRAVQLVLPKPTLGGPRGYVQLSEPDGNVLRAGTGPVLPLTAAARAVASGKRSAFFSDATRRRDARPAC